MFDLNISTVASIHVNILSEPAFITLGGAVSVFMLCLFGAVWLSDLPSVTPALSVA